MQLRSYRRSLALAVGAALLAAPALTSCGFNYATDRVYTPAAGVNDRDAEVDVLGAVIVAAQPNAGTFIASFSNNDQDKTGSVDSLAGADGNTIQVSGFDPIQLPPGGFVNLATTGGLTLSGSFALGDFVPVTVTFGDGSSVVMRVPVVTDCGVWTGLDVSGGAPVDGATPTPSDSASPTDAATPTTPTTAASPVDCGATGSPAGE